VWSRVILAALARPGKSLNVGTARKQWSQPPSGVALRESDRRTFSLQSKEVRSAWGQPRNWRLGRAVGELAAVTASLNARNPCPQRRRQPAFDWG